MYILHVYAYVNIHESRHDTKPTWSPKNVSNCGSKPRKLAQQALVLGTLGAHLDEQLTSYVQVVSHIIPHSKP